MKFSQVFQMSAFFMAFLVTLVYSASVPMQGRAIQAPTVVDEVLTVKKHNFYVNDTFDGSILELPNSQVIILDAAGEAISSVQLGDIARMRGGIDWSFLWKIRDLIAKFGPRVLEFFKCVGIQTASNCLDEFLTCALSGTPPWLCAAGGLCIGKAGSGCL